MAAPAPAPRELWENMIGQEITMDNIDMMLDERPDINDSIVYPLNRSPSPIPSGWKCLVTTADACFTECNYTRQ